MLGSSRSSSSSSSVLGFTAAAVAAAAVAVGAYVLFFKGSSGSDAEPVLTYADTLDCMTKILDSVRMVAVQHSRAADNIAQQLAAQGQAMEHQQIMTSIILPHFKNAFQSTQSQILELFDVDEEELEEAVAYHVDNSDDSGKLDEVVTKLRLLCVPFTGEDAEDEEVEDVTDQTEPSRIKPKEISVDVLIRIITDFGARTVQDIDRLAREFKEVVGPGRLSQDKLLQFHEVLANVSEQTQSDVLESYGFEKHDFEHALVKHGSSPKLQECVAVIQDNNMAVLQMHGLQEI